MRPHPMAPSRAEGASRRRVAEQRAAAVGQFLLMGRVLQRADQEAAQRRKPDPQLRGGVDDGTVPYLLQHHDFGAADRLRVADVENPYRALTGPGATGR